MTQLYGQKTHPAVYALSPQSLAIRALWVICCSEWSTFTQALALKNPKLHFCLTFRELHIK